MQTCFDVSSPCLDVPFPGMCLIPTVTSSALLPWPVGLVLGWPSEPAQSKPRGPTASDCVCLVCLTVSSMHIRTCQDWTSVYLPSLAWFMTLPWERLPKVQSCTGLNAFYCHGLKKQQQLTLYSVYIMWLAMRVVVMQQAPVDDWAKDQSVATARPHPVCLPFSITKVLCQSNAWNHETELWNSMCFRMASSC